MKKNITYLLILVVIGFGAASFGKINGKSDPLPFIKKDTLLYPDEKHFKNIRQLTFGGDNAEAYFSYDGKYLVFQHKDVKEGVACDQMYTGRIPAEGGKFEYKMLSNGKGRTTCGFYMKDGKHIVYS
jgi:TolB protein